MKAMEADIVPLTDKRGIGGEWWRFFSERKTGRLLSLGVQPLSWAYGGCGLARRKLYASRVLPARRLPCKVISVGNLTVGGAGKTPAVISIAETLARRGVRTAVISRGYRGKYTARSAIVSDGQNVLMGPDEAGDEPYMMARALSSVPVIVGKDRFNAGLLAWEEFGVQAVILDDAYQQLGLVKDLNILLINWRHSPAELHLLPLGGLREPLSQISRADIVLYTMCHGHMGRMPLLPFLENIPTFMSRHLPAGLRRIDDQRLLPVADAAGKKTLAFCGIARPRSFLDTLHEAGVQVLDLVAYPDHYRFTSEDLAELSIRARGLGAEMIITTEKDAVKIDGYASGEPPFLALRIEFTVLEHREEWEWYLIGCIEPDKVPMQYLLPGT